MDRLTVAETLPRGPIYSWRAGAGLAHGRQPTSCVTVRMTEEDFRVSSSGAARGGRIALTFDDGPAAGTLDVLKALVDEEVPATFFLVGKQVRELPHVVRELADAGGIEIGSHSLDHIDLTKASTEVVTEQIAANRSLLEELAGHSIRLFRPPWGRHDTRVDQAARDSHQSLILYTLDSRDWQHQSQGKTIKGVAASAVDGDVILLHDTLPSTVAATRSLVRELKSRGFTLVTVSDLLGPTAPGMAYDGLVDKRTRVARRVRREAATWRARGRRLAQGKLSA